MVSAVVALAFALAGAPLGADIFSFGDVELLAFRDPAANDATPLRVVTSTPALNFKNALALDTLHRELIVGRSNRVSVFDANDSGPSSPLREIVGGNTGLGSVSAVALDLESDLLYVACYDTDEVSVFHRTDVGNVTPLRVLAGPLSTIDSPEGLFLDLVHDRLLVAISPVGTGQAIASYNLGGLVGSGTIDLAPVRKIVGAATLLGDPRGIALDLRSDLVVVADRLGAIGFYPRLANGNVAPVRRISGGNAQIGAAGELQILDSGEIVVGNDGFPESRLVFHAFTANGEVNPLRQIYGPTSQLTYSIGVASSRARDCASGKSVDGCLFRDNFEAGTSCDWSVAAPAIPGCL